jgi:hypothetical protein
MNITYVGKKPFFDNLYGTGLTFATGQTRDIPPPLAQRFLRHADVFSVATGKVADKTSGKEPDDTVVTLEKAAVDKAETDKAQSNIENVRDQIMAMDKVGLEEFARLNFRQEIDRRKSVETLRLQVSAFLDQFGLP